MKPDVKLQIIKHALQHYILRDGASEKDILKEKRLLNEVTGKVENLKEQYKIK